MLYNLFDKTCTRYGLENWRTILAARIWEKFGILDYLVDCFKYGNEDE